MQTHKWERNRAGKLNYKRGSDWGGPRDCTYGDDPPPMLLMLAFFTQADKPALASPAQLSTVCINGSKRNFQFARYGTVVPFSLNMLEGHVTALPLGLHVYLCVCSHWHVRTCISVPSTA